MAEFPIHSVQKAVVGGRPKSPGVGAPPLARGALFRTVGPVKSAWYLKKAAS